MHLPATLGWAEAFAVHGRLAPDRSLPTVLADTARDVVTNGPWRRLSLQPAWKAIEGLAVRWPVRGADLWHLAAAATLRRELPPLQMIPFDSRLALASPRIGLTVIS